jgi:hypothetical protein
MAVDESGRVRLAGSVSLLHPEQQTVEEMLQGWRNQQLSRNLQFATALKAALNRTVSEALGRIPGGI